MNIEKIALWIESNEWFPKMFAPVFALTFCFGLAYFTALFMGRVENANNIFHLAIALMMLFSGFALMLIYIAVGKLDERDGY